MLKLMEFFSGYGGAALALEKAEIEYKSVWHSQNKPKTMLKINKAAFEWLCMQETI